MRVKLRLDIIIPRVYDDNSRLFFLYVFFFDHGYVSIAKLYVMADPSGIWLIGGLSYDEVISQGVFL